MKTEKLIKALQVLSLEKYLQKQKDWSSSTFGDTKRTEGIIKHIKSELNEIEENPEDLMEWVDVIILALDGYWRHGGNPDDIMFMLRKKQNINFDRTYEKAPDNEPSYHKKHL